MDAREKLIVDALRFAVWAAGEGIIPVDGPVEPETFLFDYATATGDEDYDTLPDRLLADSAIIHRDENHGPTLERAAGAAGVAAAEFDRLIESGKGEHGKPGYVTDAVWHSWSGKLSALNSIAAAIRAMGEKK